MYVCLFRVTWMKGGKQMAGVVFLLVVGKRRWMVVVVAIYCLVLPMNRVHLVCWLGIFSDY